MFTLSTIADIRRQNPDGSTESVGTNCFITVITGSRKSDFKNAEHESFSGPTMPDYSKKGIDHSLYDYE